MAKTHSMGSADRWISSPHRTPISQQREERRHQRWVPCISQWTSFCWLPGLPGLFSFWSGTWPRLCLDCECFQMFAALGGTEARQAVIGMQASPTQGAYKTLPIPLANASCLEACWLPVTKGKENITVWWNGSFCCHVPGQNVPCAKWHLDGIAGECNRKMQWECSLSQKH